MGMGTEEKMRREVGRFGVWFVADLICFCWISLHLFCGFCTSTALGFSSGAFIEK
jgi:hypothetical protein